MTRHTVISDMARDDLQVIADFIAQNNPVEAVDFIQRLRQQFDYIKAFPKAFPLNETIERGIRVMNHKNYKIFYSFNRTTIVIERIVNGRRNIPTLP